MMPQALRYLASVSLLCHPYRFALGHWNGEKGSGGYTLFKEITLVI